MDHASALAWTTEAIGRVLGQPPAVRDDTPLATVGVDAVALVCIADALDERLAAAGLSPYDDSGLEGAVTVGDVAAPLLSAAPIGSGDGSARSGAGAT